jgi:hypothetical protein
VPNQFQQQRQLQRLELRRAHEQKHTAARADLKNYSREIRRLRRSYPVDAVRLSLVIEEHKQLEARLERADAAFERENHN